MLANTKKRTGFECILFKVYGLLYTIKRSWDHFKLFEIINNIIIKSSLERVDHGFDDCFAGTLFFLNQFVLFNLPSEFTKFQSYEKKGWSDYWKNIFLYGIVKLLKDFSLTLHSEVQNPYLIILCVRFIFHISI